MDVTPQKLKIFYYYPLNKWLLGTICGNQGQTLMYV